MDLKPRFTRVCLVLESVVMGLGPWSVWADLDPRFPGTNQALGPTGVGLASGSTEAGLVLRQAGSLIL